MKRVYSLVKINSTKHSTWGEDENLLCVFGWSFFRYEYISDDNWKEYCLDVSTTEFL